MGSDWLKESVRLTAKQLDSSLDFLTVMYEESSDEEIAVDLIGAIKALEIVISLKTLADAQAPHNTTKGFTV